MVMTTTCWARKTAAVTVAALIVAGHGVAVAQDNPRPRVLDLQVYSCAVDHSPDGRYETWVEIVLAGQHMLPGTGFGGVGVLRFDGAGHGSPFDLHHVTVSKAGQVLIIQDVRADVSEIRPMSVEVDLAVAGVAGDAKTFAAELGAGDDCRWSHEPAHED